MSGPNKAIRPRKHGTLITPSLNCPPNHFCCTNNTFPSPLW
jgi:hypothetical protein